MGPMDPSITEIEIKLALPSPDEALRRVEATGAKSVVPREFEDNRVYDLADGALRADGRLLRLRRAGDRATVTFKARVPDERRYKIRTEYETAVADPDQLEKILTGLGYAVVYRYQKYRSVFSAGGVEIAVDETPIGCYIELEGEPDAIDRLAERLGFSPNDYIRDSYLTLHRAHAKSSGAPMGDMVFAQTAG